MDVEAANQPGTRHPRLLSPTEIQTAQTCFAMWAFRYGGHLTDGDTLKLRQLSATLSGGRAWGAAVAAWHSNQAEFNLMQSWGDVLTRWTAHETALRSLEADIHTQAENGFFVTASKHLDSMMLVTGALDHYMATATRLPNLTKMEHRLLVPIPSRGGQRASNRYRFEGYIDGYTIEKGLEDVVEFKFRGALQSKDQIELSRQIRWYAWAQQKLSGIPVLGVIVDERVADIPKPARLVQGKKKGTFAPSHAKDQLCTTESYIALCEEYDEDPHDDVVERLSAREWQRRTYIPFRPSELREAGRELVSAGLLIRQLDDGVLYPLRNAKPANCRSCDFRPICANPGDRHYVDTLFSRSIPKRHKAAADEANQASLREAPESATAC